MPDALIVAHGQPSDPEPASAALAAFARGVEAHAPGLSLASATLAAPGELDAAVQTLPSHAPVYPLFMARGWFVTEVLPRRLGAQDLTILDPLGVDPTLPGLAAQVLSETIAQQGWAPQETTLVLAAHGSGRSRNPSAVANAFAEALKPMLDGGDIRVGFVEEPPSIEDAARGAGARAICLPFFACQGGHATEDVPQALKAAGFQGRLLPVLGELPPVKQRIAEQLSAPTIPTS
ncbi:cobalamin biosynthesis protein CbiX [Ruegeria sp. 2012CJ41-6]|uniref:Cobalamin biosynthesis protein CbiX n=1 Tax=Ruegeria spongiae TaxID=2942209 RepID=A0ABT0Q245_9RHOB|nr:CbiX/SirB N-terminal domain-containing protein [Ruegeria spongiae]MCL6283934.1 cobalamin biosynthesis protein CbiX [Ruegeria spongiae]